MSVVVSVSVPGVTNVTKFWMDKEEGFCHNCTSNGGSARTPYSWHNHRWVETGAYKTEWVAPKEVRISDFRRSLDYGKLGDAIRDVLMHEYLFESRSRVNCRTEEPLSLLAALACNCASPETFKTFEADKGADKDNPEVEKYCVLDDSAAAATARICYATKNTMLVFPNNFEFSNSSLRSPGKCVEISIFTTSIYNYHDEEFPIGTTT